MKKKLFCAFLAMVMMMAITSFNLSSLAASNPSVYETPYSIFNAIRYANDNAYAAPVLESDCTNYVSKCLSYGGGLKQDVNWNPKGNGNYQPWIRARDLYDYLLKKGYKRIVISYKDRNKLASYIKPGNPVFYDWDGLWSDGKMDHAAICVGYDNHGTPTVDAHTSKHLQQPDWSLASFRDPGKFKEYMIYTFLLTDTKNFTDVTSRFYGRTISLKSVVNGAFVSSNSDSGSYKVQSTVNSSSVGARERFTVYKNFNDKTRPEKYPSISLKASNGNYLTARIDMQTTPVQAAVLNANAWESFRILSDGTFYYIQSQVNGKYLTAVLNESKIPLKAQAREASTWEQFILLNATASPSPASSTQIWCVNSSNGLAARTGASNSYSNVGGLGNGALFTINSTANGDGYTWGRISSIISGGYGDWGSNVGNWVKLDFCSKTAIATTPPPVSNTQTWCVNSSNGLAARTGASNSYSNVGGLGNGALFTINSTASGDGYTWGRISSIISGGYGDWGSNVGNWVKLDFCVKV